jgi:outer membrane receptor for ferrienterochelin and colicins
LTNYTQKRPIIDADNPFGQDFNATQVYAPITGAMGYVGLRFEFGE